MGPADVSIRTRRKRVLVPVLAVAAMAAGVRFWLLAPPDPKYAPSPEIEAALVSAIDHAGRHGSFDLSAVAPFPWDRAYVLGAYSGPELFEQRAGFSWEGLQRSASVVQDRFELVVFVKDRTVHWFDHDRTKGMLEVGDAPIERGDAVLDVSATPDRGISVTRHGLLPPVRKLVHMVNGQVVEVDAAALERELSDELRALHPDGGAKASPP
jgi:hypothetical protein